MRQRSLLILAAVLMVLGAGLGAGTMAFAIGSQGVVTGLAVPKVTGNRQQISNPVPFGPGMRQPGPWYGIPGPGFGQRGPGQMPSRNLPQPSALPPQQ
jgi:hypothetical protein